MRGISCVSANRRAGTHEYRLIFGRSPVVGIAQRELDRLRAVDQPAGRPVASTRNVPTLSARTGRPRVARGAEPSSRLGQHGALDAVAWFLESPASASC